MQQRIHPVFTGLRASTDAARSGQPPAGDGPLCRGTPDVAVMAASSGPVGGFSVAWTG